MPQALSFSPQASPRRASTITIIKPQLATIYEESNASEQTLLISDESDQSSEFSSRSAEDNDSLTETGLDTRALKSRIAAHAAIFPFLYVCNLIMQAKEFDNEHESLIRGIAGTVTFATLVSFAIHIGSLPNTRPATELL